MAKQQQSQGITKVRVVDLVHDKKGRPVVDDHPDPSRRKQKVHGGTYLYAGVVYRPGDVIDMPADVAERELRICGQHDDASGSSGRAPLLELFSDWEARQAKKPDEEKDIENLRNSFKRKQEELAAQVEQTRKFREMAEERQRQILRKDMEVSQAKEEVPPSIAEQLARQEQMIADLQRRLEAQAEVPARRGRRPDVTPTTGEG